MPDYDGGGGSVTKESIHSSLLAVDYEDPDLITGAYSNVMLPGDTDGDARGRTNWVVEPPPLPEHPDLTTGMYVPSTKKDA
jgi:hypothetical protein